MQKADPIFMTREQREREERYRYNGQPKPQKVVKPEKESEPND